MLLSLQIFQPIRYIIPYVYSENAGNALL